MARRHFLFLFLDGIGLGAENDGANPLAVAKMPTLVALLGGKRLVAGSAPLDTKQVALRSLDANLGVAGLPQSATGQAVLLTGRNVPLEIGYHYGPKPNQEVAAYLRNGNLFNTLQASGKKVAFIDAYPPGYFRSIESGRRLYSAIPLAAVSAGLRLATIDDLRLGRALSADFTGIGWQEHLGISDVPVITPFQAGQRLASLSQENDFTFFEYWLSDYAGHRQDMAVAVSLLETLDNVLSGLLSAWDDQRGLVLITSDHGNLENLDTRRHTENPVPALVIGAPDLRQSFVEGLHSLTDVAPAILHYLGDA